MKGLNVIKSIFASMYQLTKLINYHVINFQMFLKEAKIKFTLSEAGLQIFRKYIFVLMIN